MQIFIVGTPTYLQRLQPHLPLHLFLIRIGKERLHFLVLIQLTGHPLLDEVGLIGLHRIGMFSH